MAVIKGNIRYFAYYKSLKELREDKDVSEDYLVTVIENQVCTDYEISKSLGSNGVRLNNGLYANPIYSGNSLSDKVNQVYSTEGPILYKVGGVLVGDEFNSLPITDVLNKMFYGSAVIAFEVSTNLVDPMHVRGERHNISYLFIEISKLKSKIVKEEIYVNGELYNEYFEEWGVGEHTIEESISFIDPVEIKVILRDEEGNAATAIKEEKMMYPIFYSVVQPSYGATGTSLKRMNNHMSLDDLVHTVDTQNTCALIAIAEEEEVISDVLDENNLHIREIYTEKTIVPVTLGEKIVNYSVYKSYSLAATDFGIIYSFKEVNEDAVSSSI